MAQKTYSERLKDPRWQKKRLRILERDGFRCQACGDETTTLHVHHRWYEAADPWNDPDEALVTLCEPCHALEGEERASVEQALLRFFRSKVFAIDLGEIHMAICRVFEAHPGDSGAGLRDLLQHLRSPRL